MKENIGAALIDLSSDDLRDLEFAASNIKVQGNRYPDNLEQLTGR
jgi:hypothetical protein